MVAPPKPSVLTTVLLTLIAVWALVATAIMAIHLEPDHLNDSSSQTPAQIETTGQPCRTIIASPVSQNAGGDLLVLGCGFSEGWGIPGLPPIERKAEIVVRLGDQELGRGTVNDYGAFAIRVTIPPTQAPGVYHLSATPEFSQARCPCCPLQVLEPARE